MALHCEVLADVAMEPGFAQSLRHLIERASELEESVPRGAWCVTIRITDDSTISRLHCEYFGDAEPTDVISFPSGDDVDLSSGYLGDVLISVDTARDQARIVGHSTEREVAFLALHGMLHLCGWDDRTEADRDNMLRRQGELLDLAEGSLETRL
jgi:probable rRNA maturation factor